MWNCWRVLFLKVGLFFYLHATKVVQEKDSRSRLDEMSDYFWNSPDFILWVDFKAYLKIGKGCKAVQV